MMNNVNIQPAVRWWDVLAVAKEREKLGPLPNAGSASQREGEEFAGATWHNALRMMEYGWHEGAYKVSVLLDKLPVSDTLESGWTLEAHGFFPCVPAFLSGDPECMWQRSTCENRRPKLCLIVPTVYPCNIKAREALCYGTAVAGLVRALEASGVDVAVYSIDRTLGDQDCAVVQPYIVRDFGQPLDISIVAFAFHPAFLRRIVFAFRERNQAAVDAGIANFGYGRASEPVEEECRKALGGFEAEPVLLPTVEEMKWAGLLNESQLPRLVETMRARVSAVGDSAA